MSTPSPCRPLTATASRAVAPAIALAGLVHLAGCGPPEHSTGPELGPEEGYIVMEGDPDWQTDSVSWIDNGTAANRFTFIAIALQAPPAGRSHFLYEAPFHQRGCIDTRCFPAADELFVLPGLAIGDLDRSPVSSMVTFDGRSQTDQDHWIYTFAPDGAPRRWLIGVEPTFTPDGAAVLFISDGRDELCGLRPAAGQDWIEASNLAGAAHPRVSPDGRFAAYSAIDVARESRRIWVHDLTDPDRFDDPVSLPDRLPGSGGLGDGTDDDYPAWSPGGRFLAYRGKLRENIHKDAIFVTEPAREPEQPIRIADVSPGRQMSHLRWHPNGTVMLLILDGDVYSLGVPERYHDPR
jgi:hypothetical protein